MMLDLAVDVADIVNGLKPYGFSQADIAWATGAHRRSVANWKATSAIRADHEERLRELHALVLVLEPHFRQRAVRQWFATRNRLLGDCSPLEVLAEGHAEAVLQAAVAYTQGTPAVVVPEAPRVVLVADILTGV